MENGIAARLWDDRFRIAAWVLPALLLTVFAHQALLPLATKFRDARAQLAALRENTYEPAWLDSTRTALKRDVASLTEFQVSRERALNRDANIQSTIDRIRRIAQASGFEVVKTTPMLAKADSLRLLKIRIEGFSRYTGLLELFTRLHLDHPDLYPEEMVIRQGGERAEGRLEGHLVIYTYDRRKGTLQ
ncbi:MAG: hypothetical protein ABIW76_10810 [Fibrobacteria bacterium]